MSWSARRLRALAPLCLVPVLAVGSCKKGDPVTPGGEGAVGSDPTTAVVLAPVEHPSQLLPRDAVLLLTGKSVARAAEVFERDRLVKAFGPQYTSIRSVVTGALGHDLLDPAVWPTVGLDPEGLVGVAMLDAMGSGPVVFATIGDRAKLTEFLRSLAGKAGIELVETAYGKATVLRAKGEPGAVLMRDRLVAFVQQTGEVDVTERLVTMDPNVSLASAVGYRKATGGLRAADLTLYADVQTMVQQLGVMMEDAGAEQPAQDQALTELLVSGIEGVGLTVTVKRSGPIFDGRIVADPEAFVRRLLDNRAGTPVLTTAMNGAPLFCLGGKLQAEAALELIEAAAAADGKSREALLTEAKAKTGLELPVDLPAALAGPSELCVTLDEPFDVRKDDEPARSLGLGAVMTTADPAKAKYLVAKVASSSGKLGGRMSKRGDGYVVSYENWRDVHVSTQGARVVVSTDPALAERLASGDPGSMPSKIRPAAARGAMELPGTAISEAFDLSSGMLWLFAGRMSVEGPMVIAPGLTAEEMEKVPHSKKSKKAKKALDKAEAATQKLEREREAAQMERVTTIMDPLGMVVASATEDERGFTITGGQLLRADSLGAVVEGVVGAALSDEPALDPTQQAALDEAWERHREASEAYSKARLEDAERYLAKKNKGKSGPAKQAKEP